MNKFEWNRELKDYAKPSVVRSSWQIANTLLPYIGVNYLMYLGIKFEVFYPLVMLLAIPAGLLMVRLFILFHDCTHLSFFKSKRANSLWGHFFGILTFTPYYTWQHEHNIHHGTVGNLDRRGAGDVWTMTVEEYLNSGKLKRFIYHLYRNPIFLFVIAPFFLFGVLNRFPARKVSAKETISYVVTDLGILGIFLGTWYVADWYYYLLIQLPVLFVASVAGVWLFFVQHQFEEVYWSKNEEWDIVKAALEGSSFYKLPALLNWFTGSIGYHHIHHLNSRIPNYNLKKCFQDITELQSHKTIRMLESFKLALLQLYDEQSRKMINFKTLKRMKASA